MADRWRGRPEADLVRILMDGPTYEVSESIRRWFDRHVGWPVLPKMGFYERHCGTYEITTDWLDRAYDPRWWADRAVYHEAVLALARSMVPNARAFFPADNEDRLKLEEIAASSPADLCRGVLVNAESASEEELLEFHHYLDRRVCMSVIRAAQRLGRFLNASPWDLPNDDCTGAVIEQHHILGWSWLGLPPLRAEAALDPPMLPMPGMPAAVEPTPHPAKTRAGPLRPLWRRLIGGAGRSD